MTDEKNNNSIASHGTANVSIFFSLTQYIIILVAVSLYCCCQYVVLSMSLAEVKFGYILVVVVVVPCVHFHLCSASPFLCPFYSFVTRFSFLFSIFFFFLFFIEFTFTIVIPIVWRALRY